MNTTAPPTDALLVSAAQSGDTAAYGELFARYQSRIYNYAYSIAGNRDDAADIAQEAFVRVFEALPRMTGEVNFSAYLYRTAHNLAINTVNSRRRFAEPEALDLAIEPSLRADPERVALVKEQQEQAWRAAFRLSDNHRAILALRELHDLSYQDIADIMGMPRNTVGVLLSRARLKFKEAFRMSSVDIDRLCAECREMLPLLSAYLDDELEAEKRARVEEHLDQCAFCRLALEDMTESSRSYRAILPLLPPAALGEGLWARLDDLAALDRGAAGGQGGSPTESGGTASPAGAAPGGQDQAAQGEVGAQRSTPLTRGPVSYLTVLGIVAGGGAVLLLAIWLLTSVLFRGSSATLQTIGGGDSGFIATDVATLPVTTTRAVTTTTAAASSTEQILTSTTSPPTTVTSTQTGSTTVTSGSTSQTAGGDTAPPPTPRLIYPLAGQLVSESSLILQWEAVKDPSGVTYRVEVESFNENTGTFVSTVYVEGIKGNELPHRMRGTRERWRVTAVDGAGNVSPPSGWAKYARSTVTATTIRPTTLTILPRTTSAVPY